MAERNSLKNEDDFKISSRITIDSLRRLLTNVGKQLSALLESKRIGIYLQGREEGNWALAISREVKDSVMDEIRIINHNKNPELKKAIDKKQLCLVEDLLSDDIQKKHKDENMIITPLYYNGEVIGLLLVDFDSFASLTKRNLIQLELVAQIIKIAIDKEFLSIQLSQLKDTLAKTESFSDDVLQNEEILYWLLDRDIERSNRHGYSFAVLAIRLDNLAHIISQYDKEVSKKAICELSDAMKYLIRKCDLFVHMESDLFLCVSFEQDAAGAHVLAERLRHRIKETICIIQNYRITSTISVGIALWPDGSKITSKALINRSIDALKTAQKQGNRVRIWKT